MQIPSSHSHPLPLVGEARSHLEAPARPAATEERSPAVKLELSPHARRPSFPPSPELKDLAASLEPRDRAQQLAATLDGPGIPVALKLSTLKLMLAGEAPPAASVREPQSAESTVDLNLEERANAGSSAPLGATDAGQDPRPIVTDAPSGGALPDSNSNQKQAETGAFGPPTARSFDTTA